MRTKIAGFSGTQRGKIKQHRASGKMVGQTFHTGSRWGESGASIAKRLDVPELLFSFYEHARGVVAYMSMGPILGFDGKEYSETEMTVREALNGRLLTRDEAEIMDSGLFAHIRSVYSQVPA